MNWKEKIKLIAWGAIGGAIVLAIIGFALGGWVTGGTAHKMAKEMADEAVIDRLAPICVLQSNQDPGKDKKLAELKKLSSWNRGDYVENQGWRQCPVRRNPIAKSPVSVPDGLWSPKSNPTSRLFSTSVDQYQLVRYKGASARRRGEQGGRVLGKPGVITKM